MATTTERYINPFTDFGFKKLFGSEMNKDLLIEFLNTLLPPKAGVITNLTFMSNERVGRSEFDRRAIFDLHCKNDRGEYFIVEIQRAKQDYFKDRSVYYASFPIQEQAVRGEWNYKLSPVYMIGILDFVFDMRDNDVYHLVQLSDQATGKLFFDKLSFIYLELPKFTKTVDELTSSFEKWCYVFKHLPYLTDRPAKLQEKVFLKLFELAEIAKYSPEEAHEYEKSLQVYRDLKNVIDCAYDEGLAEGKAEGLTEGMEKGKVEGKIEIAKSMLAKGFDVAVIAEVTNLTVKEIQDL